MPDPQPGRLTALAYHILLTIGVTFSLAGVTTKNIAGDFGVDPADIGFRFTLFSVGYSLAVLGNGFVLDRGVNVGKETLAASCLAILGVIGAACWPTLAAFSFFVFVYGVGMGTLLSVSYYIVMNLYDESARATKVSLLNFYFSLGSIIAPVLAGLALGQGIGWQRIYLASLVLLLVIAVAGFSRFQIRPRKVERQKGSDEHWNAKVYIMGLTLLCYVVSEMILTYWIVLYLQDVLKLSVELASSSLSVFWIFMATGRFLSGVFIEKFRLRIFIVVCSSIAFAAFVALLLAKNAFAAISLIALVGLGYSGLYATILSYGTLQVPRPSSRLTTFFLTISGTSGMLSFVLSSYLKASFGVTTVLAVSAGLMAAVTVLTAFSGVVGKKG